MSFPHSYGTPVKNELKVLTLPYDAPDRINGKAAFDALHQLLNPKVGEFRSENGHDYAFWAANLYWDQRHDETAVPRCQPAEAESNP